MFEEAPTPPQVPERPRSSSKYPEILNRLALALSLAGALSPFNRAAAETVTNQSDARPPISRNVIDRHPSLQQYYISIGTTTVDDQSDGGLAIPPPDLAARIQCEKIQNSLNGNGFSYVRVEGPDRKAILNQTYRITEPLPSDPFAVLRIGPIQFTVGNDLSGASAATRVAIFGNPVSAAGEKTRNRYFVKGELSADFLLLGQNGEPLDRFTFVCTATVTQDTKTNTGFNAKGVISAGNTHIPFDINWSDHSSGSSHMSSEGHDVIGVTPFSALQSIFAEEITRVLQQHGYGDQNSPSNTVNKSNIDHPKAKDSVPTYTVSTPNHPKDPSQDFEPFPPGTNDRHDGL